MNTLLSRPINKYSEEGHIYHFSPPPNIFSQIDFTSPPHPMLKTNVCRCLPGRPTSKVDCIPIVIWSSNFVIDRLRG